MTDFVNVTITCEERVQYHQTAKMPKEEFERLDAMLASDDRATRDRGHELIADLWIDRQNVYNSDDFEVNDFMIVP